MIIDIKFNKNFCKFLFVNVLTFIQIICIILEENKEKQSVVSSQFLERKRGDAYVRSSIIVIIDFIISYKYSSCYHLFCFNYSFGYNYI